MAKLCSWPSFERKPDKNSSCSSRTWPESHGSAWCNKLASRMHSVMVELKQTDNDSIKQYMWQGGFLCFLASLHTYVTLEPYCHLQWCWIAGSPSKRQAFWLCVLESCWKTIICFPSLRTIISGTHVESGQTILIRQSGCFTSVTASWEDFDWTQTLSRLHWTDAFWRDWNNLDGNSTTPFGDICVAVYSSREMPARRRNGEKDVTSWVIPWE